MGSGNYYQGQSIFSSLSSIFGTTTSGNTTQPVPMTSSIVSSTESFLKKQVFGIPVYIIIIISIIALIVGFMVIK